MSGISIAKSVELHLQRPLITRAELDAACDRADELRLAAVSVWPVHVARVRERLARSSVKVRAAIGVPGGQLASQEVRAQCERALADGADEIAIMPDHSALVDPIHPEHALDCIAHVIDQAGWAAQTNTRSSVELTLILETMWLGPDRLAPLLNRCEQTPIGFVQTSAGLDAPILTESHVRFLREHTPESIGVIAVGDVASFDVASALLSAGATRLGSAGALAIVEEERRMIEQRRATT